MWLVIRSEAVTALAFNKKNNSDHLHTEYPRDIKLSSRNRFALIKAVETVRCSLSAMDFPDFVIWWFISSLVNMGIFSREVI